MLLVLANIVHSQFLKKEREDKTDTDTDAAINRYVINFPNIGRI